MADFNLCPGIWQFKVMFIWELHDIWSQFLRHFNFLSLLFVKSWGLFTHNSPAEYLFAWESILLNFVYLNEMLLVCYMTATCLVSVSWGMLKFLETYASDLSNQQPASMVISGVLRHWHSEFSQKLEPLCCKSAEFQHCVLRWKDKFMWFIHLPNLYPISWI